MPFCACISMLEPTRMLRPAIRNCCLLVTECRLVDEARLRSTSSQPSVMGIQVNRRCSQDEGRGMRWTDKCGKTGTRLRPSHSGCLRVLCSSPNSPSCLEVLLSTPATDQLLKSRDVSA